MIGRTLAHYHIDAAIGAGGMGQVYRATDTKLGRSVALKVLPPDMARDAERLARFQREARAVAALNHPHIVTIFSVEEQDGVHFLTMELVEGRTLDRLIPDGGLSVDRIVEIGNALADALSAAHEKGIVHRDLKPANVMVTSEDRVKVLDFGLAKEVRATQNENTMSLAGHTQAGVVMGTPAYMSPEQVVGRELDHRTDIFSLGVLLHEMATGRRPFAGQSSAELHSAILRDTPPLVTDLRADLPPELARIVRRCLEKDPRHRLQTARDVANEFRDLVRESSRKASGSTPAAPRALSTADSGVARAAEGYWVAVLPFKYLGSSAELKALAEGLSEEVVTGLSRFSYLRVIARGSTAKYSGESADVRAVGKELGARYVMEGSLRQAASKLRLAVQLVDTVSGAHLWAETYERGFAPDTVFDLQDDLVPRIVSTVADQYGVLPRSISDALRGRNEGSLTPHECLLRAFSYFGRITPEEHAAVRRILERAVREAPDQADCWAMLAQMYNIEFADDFNPRPDPLDRALAAAQRAVDLAPTHSSGHYALAFNYFFRKEIHPFRAAVERAVALNPMDGAVIGQLGLLMEHLGSVEEGSAMVETAMRLNPNYPSVLRFVPFVRAYREARYEDALEAAVRINMPGFFHAHAARAAALGQLGRHEAARKAVQELLAIRPDFTATMRRDYAKWWDPALVEHMADGLRKAGLEIPDAEARPAASGAVPRSAPVIDSGATRAEEGFWVAVLPFKCRGADAALEALAEGLSDEIVTGLSRFSYLRVIARGSTAKYSGESGDVRAVGKALGARYVLEGSLRQAGSKLRLAVQLLDTASGAHLWAENYERAFDAEAAFDLQDDLVPRIVSTVADMNGVLPRSMSEGLRSRAPEELSPYQAVLRSFAYTYSATPQELNAARLALEEAVRKAPAYADAWAMLSFLCGQDYVHGYELQANASEIAASAARQAVAAGPSNHLAYFSLAQALWNQRDHDSFREAAERAVALNPMDGNSVAFLGELLVYAGGTERGMELVTRAKQLNPNHPGWYWFADFYHAFSQRDYRGAVSFALKAKLRGNPLAPMFVAAACGQLGDTEGGSKAAADLLRFRPELPGLMRKQVAKVWNPEYGERFLEGLRKAGINIPQAEGSEEAVNTASLSTPSMGVVTGPKDTSGAMRAREGFWVAVLPFKYAGPNEDLKALAEGLTDEVITGLSRFSYLRVIARGSTAKYSSESRDIPGIGKEVGARYVMEGSIRQAGAAARLAVQLLDAATGTHLWAETFERPFRPDAIFALQDELVPRIVSTVADQHGILPRSISAAIRKKGDAQLSPYEAVFRVFSLHERMTAAEHSDVRDLLERAVKDEPDQGDCWAMLATLYADEDWFGFNLRPDPLGRALAAARRAMELAPASALASQALAQSLFMRRELQAFRPVAERTIALNPMDGATVALIGLLLACAGDWDRGCAVAESAMRLNPHFPGWYRLAPTFNAYRTRDYRAAIDAALRIQIPNYFWVPLTCAAAFGQLGDGEQARKALAELLALRGDFSALAGARNELGKWFDQELTEHFVEGLCKAGLELAQG